MRAIDDLKAEVIRLSHPAANVFPLMSESDLQSMAADIAAHGLRERICRDSDGRIIDGRNRWIACQVAGVDAKSMPPPPDMEIEAFIKTMNVERRHLSASERAAIAGELANMDRGVFRGNQWVGGRDQLSTTTATVSIEEAAEIMNVSRPSVVRARQVKKADPEIFEEVKAGKKTLNAAMIAIGKPVVQNKPKPAQPNAQRVAGSGKPALRVVAAPPEIPDHIARLRLWLTSGARLSAEITDPAAEWADYGHLLALDDIDEILSFVAALSAASKAVRAA